MVTRNVSAGPFPPGAPVRLLVGVLAWPARGPTYPGRAGRPVPPTYLTAADDLRFVEERSDKPGGCVVADASGERWYVPTGFLTGAEA